MVPGGVLAGPTAAMLAGVHEMKESAVAAGRKEAQERKVEHVIRDVAVVSAWRGPQIRGRLRPWCQDVDFGILFRMSANVTRSSSDR
ncbi:hypothetical protein GCM10009798_33380 [Nocardioides panacihumi]|uniref:Uncharacterized protein n=1 Tax=Nocardioides panacihumi TaxID=400774 RepID=A0ABN2RJ15_9ACTN